MLPAPFPRRKTLKTSIGTAVHLHPAGTAGTLCRWHNRSALATTVASIALRGGLDADASDDQLAECAGIAKGTPLKRPLSEETLSAVRSALAPALDRESGADDVVAAVFDALPDKPIRIVADDGQEFFLVPIPVT
ncbi:hypothetical protein OG689_41750 [Kitasatospora sp. NBC_00240]|uniref:hypothetical protein n=1 Tax=Kitasatospora sp. NBC_00240 TaxID=2903567 RepID=UPI002250307C|nr:hypothetical protein [Kitasatospora sp. NBC_00240]MCX5215683.1 hypothetical protein [Kitasatospora sp. NBC_00240]